MRKYFVIIIIIISPLFYPRNVLSQEEPREYAITSFKSDILIEKDTSIRVTETIGVYYPNEKFGIYRNIPYIYSANGKTIRTNIDLESVRNEKGVNYMYETRKNSGDFQVKIGDPKKSIQGSYTYIITYKVSRVLQRYPNREELYWNITGHKWDTTILSSEALVTSPYAEITKVDCFAGEFQTASKDCSSDFKSSSAYFTSTKSLGNTRDFTIVISLSKENGFVFPNKIEETFYFARDNWAYAFSLIPFLLLFYFWYTRGRDRKYAGENVYYKPYKEKVVTKPIFYREYLPMVYSPIQGLTPSEIGTIVDQKVDINDIVAEITELARLGYLKIVRLEKDKFMGKDIDYLFVKLNDDASRLADYQEYLFEKLFDKKFTNKAQEEMEQWVKKDPNTKEYETYVLNGNAVFLSSLDKEFYAFLDTYRDKLYKHLSEDKVFDGRPDKVRQKWIAIIILLNILSGFIAMRFGEATGNYGPLIILIVFILPSFVFAFSMPRRSAWGYSLYRQIKGLSFYLNKGKWREVIAEKQLFFAEMLPIAISLGVVNKLAKDMEGLGIVPPSYFSGVQAGTFARDFSSFESKAASTIGTAPSGKSSSWSGGSGFSGGSSGGGFGGGGGGSW